MRSPAERARTGAEWVLRAIVIALLAAYFVYSLGSGSHAREEHAASGTLPDALARWSTAASPARVHVDLAHPPVGYERDWLAALSGAGTAVQWSGPSLLPTALVIEPRVDPAGGADVSVAAPADVTVLLRDTLGVLDNARADHAGVRAFVAQPRATLDAAVGPVIARAALRDSLRLGRLLVIGAAGWETKFAIAALEERGWEVDAHVPVSRQTIVRQGDITEIDTARYSAVLAIDTMAARYGDRIARYVRAGGGLVLWPPAARLRSLAPIAVGAVGMEIESDGGVPGDSAPRSVLTLTPVVSPVADAVALERRGDHIALAARRIGAGRVIQNGYTDSWRWRMAGGEDAPDRHRAWLAGLVANVAYAGRSSIVAPPTDAAPVASLVDRLGRAVPDGSSVRQSDPAALARLVFAVLCIALLAEWASRRTRGVK